MSRQGVLEEIFEEGKEWDPVKMWSEKFNSFNIKNAMSKISQQIVIKLLDHMTRTVTYEAHRRDAHIRF
jgi:hypothetical protein